MSESAIEGSSRSRVAIGSVLLVVAAVLRLSGFAHDLWLDEVWALRVATEMSSPLGVFTLHHEINHHLNTLWLYLVGPNAPLAFYHLPSYLLGVASVGVAGAIGWRRGEVVGVATMLVFALSYELVLYSSEARGYAAVVFFTLLAFLAIESFAETRRIRWLALFWCVSVLGLLSHPVYAAFLGALIAQSAWTSYRSTRQVGPTLREVALVYGIPVGALAVLWLFDLRLVVEGGGTPSASLIDAYGSALAWAVGTARPAPVQLLSCIVAVALLVGGIARTRREGDDRRVLYWAGVVLFPLLLVLVRGSNVLYVRHFITAAIFLLLLLGQLLGAWWSDGRRTRAVIAAGAFAAINLWNVMDLAMHGRGQYRAAIAYMTEQGDGDATITIGSDHDFRVGTELAYYLPRAETTRRLAFVAQGEWPDNGPTWLILHREANARLTNIAPVVEPGPGMRYRLSRSFPSAPLSGLHWFVYRREGGR
ncbi:MAG: hypothetical protein ABIT20_03165 [Gemmatimonadaceae bacterium]